MGERLEEFGVSYSRGPGSGLQEFRYRQKHKETGWSSDHSVYCESESDFERLMDRWRADSLFWEYTRIASY